MDKSSANLPPHPRPPLTRGLSKIYLIFDWGREKSRNLSLPPSSPAVNPPPSSEGGVGSARHNDRPTADAAHATGITKGTSLTHRTPGRLFCRGFLCSNRFPYSARLRIDPCHIYLPLRGRWPSAARSDEVTSPTASRSPLESRCDCHRQSFYLIRCAGISPKGNVIQLSLDVIPSQCAHWRGNLEKQPCT